MCSRVMIFHLIWALQEESEEGLETGETTQSIMFSLCKKEDLGLSLSMSGMAVPVSSMRAGKMGTGGSLDSSTNQSNYIVKCEVPMRDPSQKTQVAGF